MLIGFFNCSKVESNEIKAPGIVDGDIITIKSAVAGTIQELAVKEGQKVSKDMLMARLDPDKIQNQLKDLEISRKEIDINAQKISKKIQFLDSNIRYLRKQVQRFRRLKKKNSIYIHKRIFKSSQHYISHPPQLISVNSLFFFSVNMPTF